MDIFTWLGSTALVNWLLTTGWVYPWVISFHSIGMGFLVGVMYMLCLRLLGFGDFQVAPFERYMLVVRIAFTISLFTGAILFVLQAEKFFYSPTFRIKMLLIVFALLSTFFLTRALFGRDAEWPGTGNAPGKLRLMAALTLVFWTGAIVAGRLTAYLP